MDILSETAVSLTGSHTVREYLKSGLAAAEFLSHNPSLVTSAHISVKFGAAPVIAAERILARCERCDVSVIPFSSDGYPALLREILDPPIVLYCKGTIPSSPAVSIVGTRRSDRVSDRIAYRAAEELARAGLCVVSGMAIGIDRSAHLGAIDAGDTVAVLPHGIDLRSPVSNIDLYSRIDEIIGRGGHCAVISEFPPGIRCYTWTFVRRNRIISGMSRATLVVKAPLRSGAMITARLAADQGREVFVCGGYAFDDEYAGCQRLIRDGATIFSSTDDILSLYGRGKTPEPDWSPPLFCHDPTGEKILDLLNKGCTDIDTIIRELSLPVSEIRRSLILLELEGFVRVEGGSVCRARG